MKTLVTNSRGSLLLAFAGCFSVGLGIGVVLGRLL
jgi:hypothetical protein